jgi:glutaminyl-peptide cyclotransferase
MASCIMSVLLFSPATFSTPLFDSLHAFQCLEKQCSFGPRVPGTPASRQCRDYLIQTLKPLADKIETQSFLLTFGKPAQTVTATNIIARFGQFKKDRILLCAHWDSRPWADQDPDPQNRTKPVPGANDGASGVAVLLEIAALLSRNPPPIGVDIVLFDGEDAGNPGNDKSWAQGSAFFAAQKESTVNPRFGILLDMIGDAHLSLYQEYYSTLYARDVVDKVWQTAAKLGFPEFISHVRDAVFDDHIPLLEAGIQCIDIIDLNYPHWHTTHDTPDKCSAASLQKTGSLLAHIIYDD